MADRQRHQKVAVITSMAAVMVYRGGGRGEDPQIFGSHDKPNV